jgi:ferredoxin
MDVQVDPKRCQGHGNCYAYHPELFSPDDEAFAVFVPPAQVNDALIRAAHNAAEACPERAITVTESHTTPRPDTSAASA